MFMDYYISGNGHETYLDIITNSAHFDECTVDLSLCQEISSLCLRFQIFDISWDPFLQHRLVSCGVKHIKVSPTSKKQYCPF